MNLTQKNILITGATGGIGSTFAKEFANRGANLILTDLKKTKLKTLASQIKGASHKTYPVDFTNHNQIFDFVEKLNSEYENIDILVNNAAIGVYKSLKEIELKKWLDSFNINVHAPFILTKLLLPKLNRSKQPIVLNIGSVCGVKPKGHRVAYNSTKFALRGLSLTLTNEFKNSKLQFSLITLNSVMTEFGPKTIAEKEKMKDGGKNYLDSNYIAKLIADKIQNNNLENEIVL